MITPHVLHGRDSQLALVRELLEAGELRVVVFHGPGGIGKTDLLGALADEAEAHGRPHAFVDLDRAGLDPLSMFSECARRLSVPPGRFTPVRFTILLGALLPSLPAAPTLSAGMLGAVAAATGQGPYLRIVDAALRSVRSGRDAWREANVEQWMAQRFSSDWRRTLSVQPTSRLQHLLPEALAYDLAELSVHVPLLLFDGLLNGSALDDALRQMLEQLGDIGATAVTVISAYDPGRWERLAAPDPLPLPWRRASGWAAPGRLQIEQLPELGRTHALELVRAFDVSRPIAHAIADQLGGLPGALVAAVELLEGASEDQAREALQELQDGESPLSRAAIETMLRGLVRRLDKQELTCLQALAVPESVITHELSHRLFPDPQHDEMFMRLAEKRLLRPIGQVGQQAAYRLHPVLRNALRAEMLPGPEQQRRQTEYELWLEEQTADLRVADFGLALEYAERLAAKDPSRALRFALPFVDMQAASHRLALARQLGWLLVETRMASHETAELQLALGRIELAAHDYAAAERHARAAADAIADRHTPLRLAAIDQQADAKRLAGKSQEALSLYATLAAAAEEHDLQGEPLRAIARLRAAWGLSQTFFQIDDVATTQLHDQEVERLLPLLEELGDSAERRFALSGWPLARFHFLRHRARVARCVGDYARAEELARQAWEGYGEAAPIARAYCDLTRGKLRLEQNLITEASELAARSAEAFRSFGDKRGYASALVVRADCAIAVSDWSAASAWLEDLESNDDVFPFAPAYAALGRGEVFRRIGEPERAQRLYETVEPITRPMGSSIETVVALLGLAECHRTLNETDAAWRSARQALSDAQRSGYLMPIVWARLVCSEVALPWERPALRQEAAIALTTATRTGQSTLFEEAWLEGRSDEPVLMRSP